MWSFFVWRIYVQIYVWHFQYCAQNENYSAKTSKSAEYDPKMMFFEPFLAQKSYPKEYPRAGPHQFNNNLDPVPMTVKDTQDGFNTSTKSGQIRTGFWSLLCKLMTWANVPSRRLQAGNTA